MGSGRAMKTHITCAADGRWSVSLEEIDVIHFLYSDGSYYVPTLFAKLLILGKHKPFDDSLCPALKKKIFLTRALIFSFH
jgi:hypothetical protein